MTARAPSRYYYRAFGRCLSAAIEFPELASIAPTSPAWSSPTWTFDLASPEAVSTGGRLLGEEPLYPGVSARLYEHTAGHRIEVDDTGT